MIKMSDLVTKYGKVKVMICGDITTISIWDYSDRRTAFGYTSYHNNVDIDIAPTGFSRLGDDVTHIYKRN